MATARSLSAYTYTMYTVPLESDRRAAVEKGV
jgi:hypothetical protein